METLETKISGSKIRLYHETEVKCSNSPQEDESSCGDKGDKTQNRTYQNIYICHRHGFSA
jgi:hypothetical protein